MDMITLAGQIEKALDKELPGTDVQWEMASSDRKIKNFPRIKRDDSKLAAVLILLYPLNGKVHTLFIQRPVYNGVHSGQIGFPGGKQENTDINLINTALREACEETGICTSDITVLGKLTPLYIPVSNIEVTPVIAATEIRPNLVPSKDEVVSLIEAELSAFIDPGIIKEKPMVIRGEDLDVKYYDYCGNIIWGATAMILHELLVIIRENDINLQI